MTNTLPTLEDMARWVLDRPAPAGSVRELVDLASVGMVLHAWRNSPLEDAHASAWSPLTDGEMMRANAATTRLVRELFVEFSAGVLDVDVPPPAANVDFTADNAATGDRDLSIEDCSVLDEFDDIDLLVEDLLRPLHLALLRRVLPCGYTVAEVTGELYDDLDEHIAQVLDGFAHIVEMHGLRAALYMKAIAGRSQNWWLTPAWPDTVHALQTVLADSKHPHWEIGGYPDMADRPDRCAEVDQLVSVLKEGPDRLTAAEARWCVQKAGIGYCRHRVHR
ncbi:hypothetical protein [Saccharopolyspora phatthalungensis]|uniref:Uncharacterized protein n=1 Tax=Saccharopolyspora phatthalungensis TaxID=664693 RepID=A0A840Q4I3_9PSEU|nr:hypothetical protein [Saccharopolyspora phatthalungensis]MBB5157412.1 hypothetical protein [Saccharopolyspora phatthalungensis]